jgi:hypothetical protein
LIIEKIAVAMCLIVSLIATTIIGQTAPTLSAEETTATAVVETEQTVAEPPTTKAVTEPPTTEEVTVPTVAETTAAETTVEEVTEPEPTEPPYSLEELEMLALVIYQEVGSDACSNESRLMVGTVVMNRVASGRYPNTLYEVLTQEAQYGRLHWTGLVWPERASKPGEAHAVARAYEIAERILLGERALPEDVIYQAEFPQGSEVVAYQDGMYFCR